MSLALDFESGPSIVGKEERKRKLEDEEAPPVLAKRQRFLKKSILEAKQEDVEEDDAFEIGLGPVDTQGADDDTKSNCTSLTDSATLPISFAGQKVNQCFMCKVRADEKSPLNDEAGQLVPWRYYTKYKDGILPDYPDPFKKPKGEKCSICCDAYVANGFSAKYGTMENYKSQVIAKSQTQVHTQFLQDRKIFIEEHNKVLETVGAHKKLAKRTTKENLKKRKLSFEESLGSSIRGRKRQFVETEHWNEKEDGVFDKSKEVEEFIMGKTRKGCWVFKGRAGVWEAQEEHTSKIKDERVEDEGAGVLQEAAMTQKKVIMANACYQHALAQEAVAVEATQKSHTIEDLMAIVGFIKPAEGGAAALGQDAEVEECVSSEEDEDVAEIDEQQRLMQYFNRNSATGSSSSSSKTIPKASGAHPKAASSKPPTIVASSKPPTQTAFSKVTSASPAKAAPSTGSKPVQSEVRTVQLLDGRVERIQTAVAEQLRRTGETLDQIRFEEDFRGVSLVGETEKEFVAALNKKGELLAKHKKEIAETARRIDRSANSTALDQQKKSVGEIGAKLALVSKFIDFMRKPIQDLQACIEHWQELLEQGYSFSKPYILKVLDAAVQEKLAFSDDAGVCSAMEESSDISRICILSLTREELKEVYLAKVEGIIINLLTLFEKEYKKSKAVGKKKTLVDDLIGRLSAYGLAASSPACAFSDVAIEIQNAIAIVNFRRAEITSLENAVNNTQRLIDNEGVPPSLISSFFCSAGKTIFDEAAACLSERSCEIAITKDASTFISDCRDWLDAAMDAQDVAIDEMVSCYATLIDVGTKLLKKKREGGAALPKDLAHSVQKALSKITTTLQNLLKGHLGCCVDECLVTFKEAIENDGYITIAGTAAENSLRGACIKGTLLPLLQPLSLFGPGEHRKLLDTMFDQFNWKQISGNMLAVMLALLSKTKAWTLFGQETAELDDVALGLVAPVLVKLGVEDETLKIWQDVILAKYLSRRDGAGENVVERLTHLMQECLGGAFMSPASKDARDAILAELHGQAKLKQALAPFFTCVNAYSKIVESGSLAAPKKSMQRFRISKEHMKCYRPWARSLLPLALMALRKAWKGGLRSWWSVLEAYRKSLRRCMAAKQRKPRMIARRPSRVEEPFSLLWTSLRRKHSCRVWANSKANSEIKQWS